MSARRLDRGRVRLHPRIDPELGERLATVAAARRTSEQALVETALRQFLDGTRDGALILRQLDRQGREQQKTHRDLRLLAEAFAIFVKIWFAHTAPVPEDGKRAARLLAESRYKQFVEHVTEEFARGKRFFDDLPREEIANPDELAAASREEAP